MSIVTLFGNKLECLMGLSIKYLYRFIHARHRVKSEIGVETNMIDM